MEGFLTILGAFSLERILAVDRILGGGLASESCDGFREEGGRALMDAFVSML